MASLRKDLNRQGKPNGCWTLQFVDSNRIRHSIRLGKISLKAAETLKLKVEALQEAVYAQLPLDRETVQWVANMAANNAKLYDKLAVAGLLSERKQPEAAQLGPFIESYIDGQKSNVKAATLLVYEQTKSDLVSYFGSERLLAAITIGDATNWRNWMAAKKRLTGDAMSGRGLAPNTVRKRTGIARQFFGAAIDHELIEKNPFAGLPVTVRRNNARQRFIAREIIDRVIEACPDAEWRLIVALSRYGGLRCPSEHLALTWADINWEQEKITVRSPKTAHHEGKDCRTSHCFLSCDRTWTRFTSIRQTREISLSSTAIEALTPISARNSNESSFAPASPRGRCCFTTFGDRGRTN